MLTIKRNAHYHVCMTSNTSTTSSFISTKQAAEIIGVAEATVRAYLKSGKLTGELEGSGNRGNWKVDSASVARFLEAGGRSPKGLPRTRDPKPELLGNSS